MPETYRDEVERQSRFFAFFGSIAIVLGIPVYIPLDLALSPAGPLTVALRLAVSATAAVILALSFTPYFRKRPSMLVIGLGYNLYLGTAVWTGLARGDPAYMAGYIFIIMVALILPTRLAWSYGMVLSSLAAYSLTAMLARTDMTDLRFRFCAMVLAVETAIVCFFAYLIDRLRRDNFSKSRALLAEKNELARRNETIEKELQMARNIQERLIPASCPFPGIAALYRPMDLMGGDFFDYLPMKEKNRMGIFLSDVSGHGVPAALITSMIKSSILQSGKAKLNPAGLLNQLNTILYGQTNGNFVTAFYGIFDFQDRRMVYASAGHNPPVLFSPDGPVALEMHPGQIPLAVLSHREMEDKGISYKNAEASLAAFSRIVFYTDGLTEATGKNDSDACFEPLFMRKVLPELQSLPPEAFVVKVISSLVEFHGSDSFEDDICLICVDL